MRKGVEERSGVLLSQIGHNDQCGPRDGHFAFNIQTLYIACHNHGQTP